MCESVVGLRHRETFVGYKEFGCMVTPSGVIEESIARLHVISHGIARLHASHLSHGSSDYFWVVEEGNANSFSSIAVLRKALLTPSHLGTLLSLPSGHWNLISTLYSVVSPPGSLE